ncbi:MAG: FtsX-like permease family protein, partial [Verrucomicrobiales bacterium]
MKGQVLAIVAVMGCGIGIFIGWQSTSASLHKNLDNYYEFQRFGEVFATLNRAPLSVVDQVSKIHGVEAVDARIVEVVKLDIKTLDEPAVGKLISLPDHGESKLNGVVVIAGRLPEPGQPGEVIAEEAFVNANGFKLGDTIEAVMNGRLQTLHLVGIGMSPEYIITVQPGSIFPDDRRFGIFWVRRNQMEGVFNLSGAFNDLSVSLLPGTRSEEVILRLDRLLDRYGAMGANDRDGQLSHRFISDELAQLKVMTLIPPTIFLGVAAFLLNVVMRRVLNIQRTQIAALKAFGYSSGQIGWHYGKLVGIIVLGGALLGSVVGT